MDPPPPMSWCGAQSCVLLWGDSEQSQCVCKEMCVYICMYTYVHTHVYGWVCMDICVHRCVYVDMGTYG